MSHDGRPGPADPARTARDDAALMADAVRELRAIAVDSVARPVPAEFAAMATARLLEEISRALLTGHRPPGRVLDAALEIARHTMSYSAQR